MSYLEKTLATDEKIISFCGYHWFYFVFPTLFSLLFIYIVIANEMGALFVLLAMLPLVYAIIMKITTEQVLTNKRVFIKKGLIRRDTGELSKSKVETMSISQGIMGRIFNFGDIEFTGTGGIYRKFTYVSNPTKIKKEYESFISD